jgi:hypothetical protein
VLKMTDSIIHMAATAMKEHRLKFIEEDAREFTDAEWRDLISSALIKISDQGFVLKQKELNHER